MSAKAEEAVPLFKAVYDQPRGGAGGNLHIVLDDWNIEDESIHYCMDTTKVERYFDGELDTTLTDIERRCAEHLLTMTMEERAAALAKFDGYLS